MIRQRISLGISKTSRAVLDRSRASVARVSFGAIAIGCAAFASQVARAADDVSTQNGFYVTPMLSYTVADKVREAKDGIGGTLAAGLRGERMGFEGFYQYSRLDSHIAGGSGQQKLDGVGVTVLLYPQPTLGFFGLAGGGLNSNKGLPENATGKSDTDWFLDLGAGYVQPLRLAGYEFGIRLDARYRVSQRSGTGRTDDGPSDFKDGIFNLGLQFPLGSKAPAIEAPSPAAAVVPPAPPVDTDGDGVPDPVDHCPSTPKGDAVDANGCTLVPPPKCAVPAAGERISLAGCGSGDVIVLRGVNFEFDQSRLTADAKTILDGVAEELLAYADIKVEIGGYTDARGADDYNQRLSEHRAAAVVSYLGSRGVTADRMTSVGHGESNPVADNQTDEGRELNRRVELTITAGAEHAAASVTSP